MPGRTYSAEGVTSTGPDLNDFNFTITSITHETIVSGNVGDPLTIDDTIFIPYTAATYNYHYEVVPDEVIGDGNFRFISDDTDIATIDSNGLTTRVGDGAAHINVFTSMLGRSIDLDHTTVGGGTSNQFSDWVVGSLAKECSDAVDDRIAGETPAVAKPIYTSQDHTAVEFVRNPDCWAADLDLTCISPSNSQYDHKRAGTLISPKHAVFASHFPISTGEIIRFVTMDGNNTVFEKTIVNQVKVKARTSESIYEDNGEGDFNTVIIDGNATGEIRFGSLIKRYLYNAADNTYHWVTSSVYDSSTAKTTVELSTSASTTFQGRNDITVAIDSDIKVAVFDSDLPDSISFCKILPEGYFDYFATASLGIPTLYTDQEEKALTRDFYWDSFPNVFIKPPQDPTRQNFSEDVIDGDSGNPVFFIIDNELVLLTLWWRTTSGVNFSNNEFEINYAMASLGDDGYTVTVKDLSGYPTY